MQPLTLDRDDFYMDGYDGLIASMGHTVLYQVCLGDYQGDLMCLLRDGDRYGILHIGYGSCSGCDSLAACNDDIEEVTQLRDELAQGIHWRNLEETLQYLKNHDWEGDYNGIEVRRSFAEPALAA